MLDTCLIVGLGNPGLQYKATRHNVGALFVEQLAKYHKATFTVKAKFFGKLTQIIVNKKSVHLFIPETFMNLSGQAVYSLMQFYKINTQQILIVHDELDLPPGVVRFKQKGGDGGHNGLKNIITYLGSKAFCRLRVGIGHPGSKNQVVNFVLGQAPQVEQRLIDQALGQAMVAVDISITQGMAVAMNKLHACKE